MVRLLWVVLSVGKVEFGVRMGGMVVVGGVLEGGLGLDNTVVGLVGVLIGLLHWVGVWVPVLLLVSVKVVLLSWVVTL